MQSPENLPPGDSGLVDQWSLASAFFFFSIKKFFFNFFGRGAYGTFIPPLARPALEEWNLNH